MGKFHSIGKRVLETLRENIASSNSQQTDKTGQRSNPSRLAFATLFLKYSAMFWFIAILVGQWLFFITSWRFMGIQSLATICKSGIDGSQWGVRRLRKAIR